MVILTSLGRLTEAKKVKMKKLNTTALIFGLITTVINIVVTGISTVNVQLVPSPNKTTSTQKFFFYITDL